MIKKISIIAGILLSTTVIAQDKVDVVDETGYLNNNNILSSFASELSKKVTDKMTKEDAASFEKFKKEINDQLLAKGLNQVVYFKTADAKVNEKSLNYLNNVVLSLNNYKDLNYELYGFADARGNSDYNLQLSQNRINSIKNILLNIGVPSENIKENNYGDSESKDYKNYEEYFFDRRVEIFISKK